MSIEVKICGISDSQGLDAAREAGADLVGFVFYPPSPRSVTPEQAAGLCAGLPAAGPIRTGLLVDAGNDEIAEILHTVPLGLLQLHGSESPARCAEIRARFGLPVMKALGIGGAGDLALVADYADSVDRFLLDAKPMPGATLPGGNAVTFDWSLLSGHAIPRPWLLAGGLTPTNVAGAIRAAGAPGVDVSSGVERVRGVKDAVLIAAFVAAAKAAA
jgi:phosphoribosylanthranilate isomerase